MRRGEIWWVRFDPAEGSKSRLKSKMGAITLSEMTALEEAVKMQLGLD